MARSKVSSEAAVHPSRSMAAPSVYTVSSADVSASSTGVTSTSSNSSIVPQAPSVRENVAETVTLCPSATVTIGVRGFCHPS